MTTGQYVDKKGESGKPARKRLILASVMAVLLALLLLFGIVLPAEFGRDPLGTGRLLGLSGLSTTEEIPIEHQLIDHRTDSAEFILEPFQSLEYKYLMDINSTMVFSWQADGELVYDMHAEPAGLGEEYAESFEQDQAQRSRGTYHAPFTGIHGWFWENRSLEDITLRIHTAGFYVNATVFQDGGSFEREPEAVFD